MMKAFYFFIIFFFPLYLALNFYIGLRGWQAFGRFLTGWGGGAYWVVLILLAGAFPLSRLAGKVLPWGIERGLSMTGSVWAGALEYFLFLLVFIDLVLVANAFGHFLPKHPLLPTYTGVGVVVLIAGILIGGAWNAWHPRLRHYDITIAKAAGHLYTLRIAMASDIHLGEWVHEGRLAEMVERMNALHPDLVLLPGDIIDETISDDQLQRMTEILGRLKATYGVFAAYGNHEYYSGHVEDGQRALEAAGVTVLRDSYQKVAGSFTLVARDDPARERYDGPRLALNPVPGHPEIPYLMAGVDHTLPILMMDHEPWHLEQGQQAGVDLQFSGHTHHGQLYPNGYISARVFEQDWGYLRKGAFQVIVSCGYGTWGPPIRTGNTPELLDITVHFAPLTAQLPPA